MARICHRGRVFDVHAVLELSNRTEVARRLRQRGYQVSGETLSRWYRTKQEIPQAIAEEIARLFGIHEKEAPPAEASGAIEQQIAALMTRDEVQALVDKVKKDVTVEIRRNRETIVGALARELGKRMTEELQAHLPQLRGELTPEAVDRAE